MKQAKTRERSQRNLEVPDKKAAWAWHVRTNSQIRGKGLKQNTSLLEERALDKENGFREERSWGWGGWRSWALREQSKLQVGGVQRRTELLCESERDIQKLKERDLWVCPVFAGRVLAKKYSPLSSLPPSLLVYYFLNFHSPPGPSVLPQLISLCAFYPIPPASPKCVIDTAAGVLPPAHSAPTQCLPFQPSSRNTSS